WIASTRSPSRLLWTKVTSKPSSSPQWTTWASRSASVAFPYISGWRLPKRFRFGPLTHRTGSMTEQLRTSGSYLRLTGRGNPASADERLEGVMTRRIRNSRSGASSRVVLAVSACFLVAALSACSENSLAGLGGRSSDWIGEVATTATTTTTIPPQLLRAVTELEWINDEFGGPPSDATSSDVLAQVFARAGDASRFLQASREEIVAVVPSAEFLSQVHVDVGYVTSQLVLESRDLTLADDPTVAFGLW